MQDNFLTLSLQFIFIEVLFVLLLFVLYFIVLLQLFPQFPLRDAMIMHLPPPPNSSCPSPPMSPSAPSSSPTSLTPPAATTACARGTCTPAQGRVPPRQHHCSRNPQQRLELGLKLGQTLGSDQGKACCWHRSHPRRRKETPAARWERREGRRGKERERGREVSRAAR